MVIGIYCRFSKNIDDEQSQSSLQHQINNGKEFCDKRGYKYIVYSETISGKTEMSKRKEGNKLLNDIECGNVNGVWVDKEDRLYRNFEESIMFKVMLKKHNIKYFFGNTEYDFENDNDKIVNTILSLLGDLERKNIERRMSRGKVDRLKSGKGIGGLMWGYRIDKDKDEWVVVEEEKEKIIKVYKSFLEREWRSIRDWIYYCKKKFGVNKSVYWYYDLMRKTNYNGVRVIRYNGEVYKHKIPKIIDDKTYLDFCKKFKERIESQKGNNKKKGYDNILKGKVYCKVCKSKLNIGGKRFVNKEGKSVYDRYLRCLFGGKKFKSLYINKEKQNIPNHTSTLRYEFMSELVYRMLCKILFNSYMIKDEFRKRFSKGFDVDKVLDEINVWKKELNNINKKELKLEDNLLEGLVSKENVSKHKDKIQIDRLKVEGMIMSLEDDIKNYKETETIISWIDMFKEEYSLDNMVKKSVNEKMEIIQKYINRVELKGSFKNFELDIKLNIPIINDKIRFDKKKYWDYVNKGGDKKEYKKKFIIEKGENKINGKFSLKEGKFNSTISNYTKNIVIDVSINHNSINEYKIEDINLLYI